MNHDFIDFIEIMFKDFNHFSVFMLISCFSTLFQAISMKKETISNAY